MAPDLMQRLAALDKPVVVKPKGSPDRGRRLFFGDEQLANGGSPCFACHTIGGRGGSLAADLTTVHTRRNPDALVAATAKPGFPMMKAAYLNRPLTDAETQHLLAYFEQTAAGAPAAADDVTPFRVAAFSLAGLMLGGVALVFRTHRAGVRSRLVRKSHSKR